MTEVLPRAKARVLVAYLSHSSSGNYCFEIMGEIVREHDPGIQARASAVTSMPCGSNKPY